MTMNELVDEMERAWFNREQHPKGKRKRRMYHAYLVSFYLTPEQMVHFIKGDEPTDKDKAVTNALGMIREGLHKLSERMAARDECCCGKCPKPIDPYSGCAIEGIEEVLFCGPVF